MKKTGFKELMETRQPKANTANAVQAFEEILNEQISIPKSSPQDLLKNDFYEPSESDDGFQIPEDRRPKLISSQLVKVGPEEAQEYLKCNLFEHQRKLKDKRIDTQVKAMETGTHHGNVLAVAVLGNDYEYEYNGQTICIKAGEKVLINCQHTLHAVQFLSLKNKEPYFQEVWLQEWFCPNFESLAVAWASYDMPGSQRTPQEIAAAFLDSIKEEGWNKKSLNAVASSVFSAKIGSPQYGSRSTTAERINILMDDENANVRAFIKDVCYGHQKEVDSWFLKRNVVMMVMAETYAINQNAAKMFWEGCLFGGDKCGSIKNPKYEAREYMTTHVVGNTKGKGLKHATNDEMRIRLYQCWNAFMKNTEIQLRKIPENLPKLECNFIER